MKNLDMVKVRLVPDYKLHSDATISSPEEALKLLREELSQFDREAVCVLNLNARAKPINASIIAVGNLTDATLHPRELFKCAILSSASSIVLLHNHPSGNPEPSNDDILVTSRLIDGGKLLGIRLIDHIIVGLNNEYCSMKGIGMIEALERSSKQDIDIPENQNKELGDVEIIRSINGNEESIPLTREEVCRAYFAQQYEFDKEYIVGYLEEIASEPEAAHAFKSKYDVSVSKVLSSKKIIQSITSELGWQKNKFAPDDEALMDMVLTKELADFPHCKPRKSKEQER